MSTPNMETEDDVLKKPPTTSEEVMIYSNSICEFTDLLIMVPPKHNVVSCECTQFKNSPIKGRGRHLLVSH